MSKNVETKSLPCVRGGGFAKQTRRGCKLNDEKRTAYLEQYGIKVIRISNLDILKNFDGVCMCIDNVVKQSLSQLR